MCCTKFEANLCAGYLIRTFKIYIYLANSIYIIYILDMVNVKRSLFIIHPISISYLL